MDSIHLDHRSETNHSYMYTNNKDGSVRNSTVATEASTYDESSKRSQLSLSVGLPAGWETATPEIVFALDESLTDCSKLSSDCGSSRNTGKKHDDPLHVDHEKQLGGGATTSRRWFDSHTVPTETHDDSFFISYESNLAWSNEDDSTTSDEMLQYRQLKDSQSEIFPVITRGRSMTKNEYPTRRRSADATSKGLPVVTLQQKGNERIVSHRRLIPETKIKIGNNASTLTHDSTITNMECDTKNNPPMTTLPSRRGSSISRTLSLNELEVHVQPSRFVRSKRKSVASRKVLHHTSSGSEYNKRTTSDPISSTLIGRRPSSSTRLVHSNSMPVEGTQANICCQMHKSEEKMGKRLSRCISSPYETFESDRTCPKKNAAIVPSSFKQKVIHPLTAKLLAESRTKGQGSTPMKTTEDQDVGCSLSNRRYEVSPCALKSEAVKKTLRHELETHRRRLEKHQSFPESPTRKSKGIRNQNVLVYPSNDAPCNVGSDLTHNQSLRPTIGSSHSFPESPSRRSKPFKFSTQTASSRKGYDTIKDLSHRFNIELQLSSHIQSSSVRPKSSDHHNNIGQTNIARPDNARNASGCKIVAVQRHEPRRSVVSSRRNESNVAISNYFTPRHPTPQRDSDYQINENNHPDDSAFWHIDPHAFDANIDSRDIANCYQK